MKQVTITVTDRDYKRIDELGLKPWRQITQEEKEEYESLIRFYGTAIAHAIRTRGSE
jgi:hypothetical protein